MKKPLVLSGFLHEIYFSFKINSRVKRVPDCILLNGTQLPDSNESTASLFFVDFILFPARMSNKDRLNISFKIRAYFDRHN